MHSLKGHAFVIQVISSILQGHLDMSTLWSHILSHSKYHIIPSTAPQNAVGTCFSLGVSESGASRPES